MYVSYRIVSLTSAQAHYVQQASAGNVLYTTMITSTPVKADENEHRPEVAISFLGAWLTL